MMKNPLLRYARLSNRFLTPQSLLELLQPESESPFTGDDQGASLFLDFTRQLYGSQTAEEVLVNLLDPPPSLYLDFQSNKYFVSRK